RRGQPDEVDALLLGVGDLALAARHVGPVAAVEALDRLRALADRGAHAVHGSVAAADDDDALALRVQFAGIEFRHVVAEALAVRGGQVVDGADDAGGTRVRPAEVAALVDAGGDDHGVVLAADRVEGEVFADIAVQHELDAGLFQLGDPLHHHVLLQLEAGDAIGHEPARAVVAVIDRDLHARAAQRIGRRQPARPRADDADAFGALLHRFHGFHPSHVPGGVGDVFLDRADGDGAVPRLFDDAVAFAEPVLRADAAADLREGIGGLRKLVGFLQPALGGHPEPVGDVVVQGAMGLAIGHAALAAAAGLLGRLLGGELAVDLVEILRADTGGTFLRHLPRDGHELEHALLGHGQDFPAEHRVRIATADPARIKVSMIYLFHRFSRDCMRLAEKNREFR